VKSRNHAQELRQQGVAVVELDVGSDTSVEHAIKEVLANAGHIDVLIKQRRNCISWNYGGVHG
jgi:NADP-dependent 3-hydroxy acid dehydrogenase YdfG